MAREWELVTAALRLTCERNLLAGKGWKHSLTSGRCNKQKTSKRSQTLTHTSQRQVQCRRTEKRPQSSCPMFNSLSLKHGTSKASGSGLSLGAIPIQILQNGPKPTASVGNQYQVIHYLCQVCNTVSIQHTVGSQQISLSCCFCPGQLQKEVIKVKQPPHGHRTRK